MTSEKVIYKNLPDGAKLTDQVRVDEVNKEGLVTGYKLIPVEEKLRSIGARYQNDTLVDGAGREIRFYRPPVRGTSQGFEQDQKQAEADRKKLAELKEKYRVIEIFINPLKVL